MTDRKPNIQHLFDLACEQAGLFTARQAAEFNFSTRMLSYHTGTGRFVRVASGLYRFRDYPREPLEHLFVGWLALGCKEAFISHTSALEFHDLAELVPTAVHLTVPRRYRYKNIPGVVVHTLTLQRAEEAQIERHGILRVSTPIQAVMESMRLKTVPPDQLVLALRQLYDRGLATADQLWAAANHSGARAQELVEAATTEVTVA